MTEMIAMCGLACNDCEAYKATQANDDAKRVETAAAWSKQYGADIKPEHINCEGCTSTCDNVFSHCKVCEIRKCCTEKAHVNCAHCDDYVCATLENLVKAVPEAKARLDAIKAKL